MSQEKTGINGVLSAFEGARGLAYIVAACAILGPTSIEMLLRDRQLFMSLDWQKVLIVCFAVGGAQYALALIASFMIYVSLKVRREVTFDRPVAPVMLIAGMLSLIGQVVVMLTTSAASIVSILNRSHYPQKNFVGYLSSLSSVAAAFGWVVVFVCLDLWLMDKTIWRWTIGLLALRDPRKRVTLPQGADASATNGE